MHGGRAARRTEVQLVDIRTKQQSVSEENMLLKQPHQVQEKLESYYLANREILTTIGQYEQTLHRARRAIGPIALEHIHPQGVTP